MGFNTHSDGDVLCAALIDAIADGDFWTHFPEDDPAAEDARSLEFVGQFAGHIRRADYEVVNVDSFAVLGPVSLDLGRVSVRARSNDGLGPEGERTACGVWAAVMVRPPAPTSCRGQPSFALR